MKARHKQGYQADARAMLAILRVSPEQDFHTLSAVQIDRVLAEADRVRYQKPRQANGSRARYFYEQLQRRANWGQL